MHTKGTILIVVISLCFVLIITLSFILTNTGISEPIPNTSLLSTEESLVEEEESSIETTKNNLENSTEIIKENHEENPAEDKERQLTQNRGNQENGANSNSTSSPAKAQLNSPKKEDLHLNKQTNNTNILCLGVTDKQLEMISIYSINKENKKSAGIFLPTYVSLKVNGELLTLKEIYNQMGVVNLKKILSQCFEIDIPYHMVVDRQGLVELSEVLGPIYVENESIDIPNLFVKPVSDKDDAILQEMAQKISQPKMLVQVPKLIKIFINNVESDIGVSALWDLYRVFRNLNHSQLAKIVLWGEKVKMAGETYTFVDPYHWHNIIYETTK